MGQNFNTVTNNRETEIDWAFWICLSSQQNYYLQGSTCCIILEEEDGNKKKKYKIWSHTASVYYLNKICQKALKAPPLLRWCEFLINWKRTGLIAVLIGIQTSKPQGYIKVCEPDVWTNICCIFMCFSLMIPLWILLTGIEGWWIFHQVCIEDETV